MADFTDNACNANPPFAAFAEDEKSASYKIFLAIRKRLEQEGKLTEETDKRLLKKAEAARARLVEHSERLDKPSSAKE